MVGLRFFCHCVCVEKYQTRPDTYAHMQIQPFLFMKMNLSKLQPGSKSMNYE